MYEGAFETATQFLNSDFYHRNRSSGRFPETTVVTDIPGVIRSWAETSISGVLEHQPLNFPVYPSEWTPSMLYVAANLVLDLACEAKSAGWMMKDASAWNVLYSDGAAVFVDLASFEKARSDALWPAYGQFQRNFLLPLYADRHFGRRVHDTFVCLRDGIAPSDLTSFVRGIRRWLPLEFINIVLPSWASVLSGSGAGATNLDVAKRPRRVEFSASLSDYVLERAFERLRRHLRSCKPHSRATSRWSSYEVDCHHYSDRDRERKLKMVTEAVEVSGRQNVLDIGANAGEYAIAAAKLGAKVVAADSDVGALEILFSRCVGSGLAITPVVLNIARPTPALGWRNNEVDSFLARARGRFNLVMMLALMHHLLVTERIPLTEILDMLHDLEAPQVVLEWIAPEDQRFVEIAGENISLYSRLTRERFEAELDMRFLIVRREEMDVRTRTLYFCRRRTNYVGSHGARS